MRYWIVLIISLFLLSGCATPGMKMDKNNSNLLMLEMDMTKKEVLSIMGQPDLNEAYKSLHGKRMTIFFYYTQKKRSDGSVTKDETTPVVFENGKLIGWGTEFYETRKKVEMDININK